ncbi:MAG: hypothetical protein P1U84_05145 [Parvibaculaceae bacterium]|nr:hypothetical protein [Parvibaculaceae bacterium]|tara:strand:+ start:361 stop:789 length:429 start_codon:yes stop_codon:yes gene_type:complete
MTTPKKAARKKVTDRKSTLRKRPVGRPTKYTREMCKKVIEAGKEGCSVAEMASLCDVSIPTIYEWAKEHDEFSNALTRAQSEAEAYWAKEIRSGLKKEPSKFQGPANLKYMGMRFKERWSERQEHKHTGGININITSDDAEL